MALKTICRLCVIGSLILITSLCNAEREITKETSTLKKELSQAELSALQKQEEELFKWISTWTQVMTIAQEKAFRSVNFAGFIQEALKAAVSRTDAHSAFYSESNHKAVADSIAGKLSGIGVSIMGKDPEDENLTIFDTIDDSPAQKAGILPGDRIVEVNGEKLRGLTSDEIIEKIKGKVGTKVKLKIIRKKKPLEFEIKRAMVKDQSALCYYFKKQNVYYLAIKTFTETIAADTRALLEKINTNDCKGLIIDLRNNTGGVLEAAIETASLFIEKGSLVVTTKDRNHQLCESYYTKSDPFLKKSVPIFILINNFTASASEILAGALRHYSALSIDSKTITPQVFLVGMTTFGKGSVQQVIPLNNGCALKLTTMLYYLPDDSSIQAQGIAPDFVIKPKKIPAKELKWIEELYGRESAMKYHITKEEVAKPILLPDDKEQVSSHKTPKKEPTNKTTSSSLITSEDEESDDDTDDDTQQDKNDKRSPAEKHRDAIGTDVAVQSCVNMISLLDIAKKADPTLVETRKSSLEFLKTNYIADDPVELEKI